jgi:dihydroorotate dehydrogenase electron transfer subunit
MRRDERAVLVERRALSPDAQLLFFESPTLSTTFVPGQFTMLRAPGEGLLLRRPYSICSAQPDKGRFSLLVKVVGHGTRALAELPIGEDVYCLGPLGTFFQPPSEGRQAVIVAGGVGIAPFVCFCESLAGQGTVARVLLGGRRASDLYLRDEFERLGMNVACTTEDGSFGQRGVVTDLLPEVLDRFAEVQLYSCGPSVMLQRVAAMAVQRNIPHQVSIERRMGCGMGCCLGCVVFTRRPAEAEAGRDGEYRRACTEGPVFDAGDIVWERDPCPL